MLISHLDQEEIVEGQFKFLTKGKDISFPLLFLDEILHLRVVAELRVRGFVSRFSFLGARIKVFLLKSLHIWIFFLHESV